MHSGRTLAEVHSTQFADMSKRANALSLHNHHANGSLRHLWMSKCWRVVPWPQVWPTQNSSFELIKCSLRERCTLIYRDIKCLGGRGISEGLWSRIYATSNFLYAFFLAMKRCCSLRVALLCQGVKFVRFYHGPVVKYRCVYHMLRLKYGPLYSFLQIFRGLYALLFFAF